MRYKYDSEADVFEIIVSEGKQDYGKQRGDMIFHFNKKGELVEIEVLGASKIRRIIRELKSAIVKTRPNDDILTAKEKEKLVEALSAVKRRYAGGFININP